jgi:hypothetical protein
MKLLPKAQRRKVMRKSYSLKWIAGGFVFTMAETIAGVMGETLMPGPSWVKALVLASIFGGAWFFRLVAQNGLTGGSNDDQADD